MQPDEDATVAHPEDGELRISVHGTARIKHKVTGVVYEIEADDLDWNAVSENERQMGPETHYQALIEHNELGVLSWNLGEYPTGVENNSETDSSGHEVLENFDYGLNWHVTASIEHEPGILPGADADGAD